MSSEQPGNHEGTQDEPPREPFSPAGNHPHAASINDFAATDDPIDVDVDIEIDDDFMSPEVHALLARGVEDTGLEIDDDGDDEADGEDDDNARSVYAMSMYPRVQPAYEVEQPYESGHDSATIDSARTLYAEDFDFVIEHGRQYCGDYFLPIDQTEQTRQYVIHQVYLKLFDPELTTVPLDNPRYILDIGTGIGEWAIGMAERYPECEVFGTDIAPIQPTHQVPFNIEFHIENAEEEWIRPADTVDLVHIRNMEGAFSDWPFVYSQAFACVRPGGWIEVVDWDDFFSDRNYLSFFPAGSAPHVLTHAILEAAEAAGKPRDSRHMDKDLLLRAGFVDVRETVYDLGIGPRENSSHGTFWLLSLITGMEAYSLRLLTRHLGWDAREVRELCSKVCHATKAVAEDPARVEPFVVKLRVMVGRKPAAATMMPETTPATVPATANGHVAGVRELSGDESTIGDKTLHVEAEAL